MTLFIRDEIPVRQLGAQYKFRLRQVAARDTITYIDHHIIIDAAQARWQNVVRWNAQKLVESVALKGA